MDFVSKSTFRLFDCEGQLPTANYDLEKAVSDGYLNPFEVFEHTTQFLRELMPQFTIQRSDVYGIDPDAKEAIAFAILAHEFIQGRPGNLPSATGARHAAILGKSSPVS